MLATGCWLLEAGCWRLVINYRKTFNIRNYNKKHKNER